MDTRRRSTVRLFAGLTVVAACVIAVVAIRDRDSSPTVFGLPVSPARTDSQHLVTPPQPAPNQRPGRATLFTTRPHGYLMSMPWELIGVREGGRTLVVHFVGGDGVRPGGIYSLGFTVIDKPSSVELIAISRNDNPDSDEEAGSLQVGYATVTLTAPITGRALLHAPTSSGWQESLRA